MDEQRRRCASELVHLAVGHLQLDPCHRLAGPGMIIIHSLPSIKHHPSSSYNMGHCQLDSCQRSKYINHPLYHPSSYHHPSKASFAIFILHLLEPWHDMTPVAGRFQWDYHLSSVNHILSSFAIWTQSA